MKKKINIFLYSGALLIFTSFAAMVLLHTSAVKKYVIATQTAEIIEQMLPARTAGIENMFSSAEMPVLAIDDTDYVALLNVNKMRINLPIQSKWDKNEISNCPCRFYGSCYDGSMVIGGSENQFNFLITLDLGEKICITDMIGVEFNYAVEKIERSKSVHADKLINNNYPLTLFARDKQTSNYVIVRCTTTV